MKKKQIGNFIRPRTAVVLNLLFITIYVAISFSIANPWLVFALFLLTAILIRSGVLIWMGFWAKSCSEDDDEEISKKSIIVASTMNLLLGIIVSGSTLGILWTIGYFWSAARSVIIFIVSCLDVFIAYQSLFPLSFIRELHKSIDKIRALEGDVVELAPTSSDACVLWLRSGFNGRHNTWERIRDQWKIPADTLPWKKSEDTLIPIKKGTLRYIYIFSNPNEAKGMDSVYDLKSSISTVLDRLSELGCRKPAFIHIPLLSKDKDQEAAVALIEALGNWNFKNPEGIDEAYLVDRNGDFSSYIN